MKKITLFTCAIVAALTMNNAFAESAKEEEVIQILDDYAKNHPNQSAEKQKQRKAINETVIEIAKDDGNFDVSPPSPDKPARYKILATVNGKDSTLIEACLKRHICS